MSAANLTEKQAAFVKFMVGGLAQGAAAQAAGYTSPDTEACRLVRLPHIRAALYEERQRIIETDLANVAITTLRDLMTSGPAPVRFSATKLSLALAGHTEIVNQDKGLPTKPLSEMTQAELLAAVDDARRLVAAADAVVIDAEAVDAPISAPTEPLALASPTAAATSDT